MLITGPIYCCMKLLFNFVNGIGSSFFTCSSLSSALLLPRVLEGWFEDFKLFSLSQMLLLLFRDVLSRSRLVCPLLSLYYLSVSPISLYRTDVILEFFLEG